MKSANVYRSHNCGELRKEHVGKEVRLSGWVHSLRDHGKELLFITLRDHYGLTQVVLEEKLASDAYKIAKSLHSEYLITVVGIVEERTKDRINNTFDTGEIEVIGHDITILNKSKLLPFEIDKETSVSEYNSLKYRYLHLRRPEVRARIIQRDLITKYIRGLLHSKGFVEIETPLLTKTTPEGARDFLVPSRLFPGTFYALPQSPQQYKELLMVSGFDRYFQIPRCLRDEDPRADRQPEHTQIDMEMSFVERDDVLDLLETLFVGVTENVSDKKLKFKPLPRIPYHQAMEKYGSDKPDLRFEMQLCNVSDIVRGTDFRVFNEILKQGGSVRGIVVPGCADYSRKKLDEVIELSKTLGLKGLTWIIPGEESVRASSGKNISQDILKQVIGEMKASRQDLILLAADKTDIVLDALGRLRLHFGKILQLRDPDEVAFAFVVDFPLFKWDDTQKRYDPLHHMFVMPKEEHMHLLESDPLKILSTQYDVVCNGYEMCSGSIRIHKRELQEKIMKMIGLSEGEILAKFNHLLTAFEYGAPPHGGAAPGLDRLVMVLTGTESMRDVVALPKTQSTHDPLMEAPSPASDEQLQALCLKLDYQSMKPEWLERIKQFKTFKERTF